MKNGKMEPGDEEFGVLLNNTHLIKMHIKFKEHILKPFKAYYMCVLVF